MGEEEDESISMQVSSDSYFELQASRYNSIAENSLSSFRYALVMIGVYITVLAFYSRSGIDIERVFSNEYTALGFMAWISATIWFVIIYHQSKSLEHEFLNDYQKIDDGQLQLTTQQPSKDSRNLASEVTAGLLCIAVSIAALSYGLISALYDIQPSMFFILILYSTVITPLFVVLVRNWDTVEKIVFSPFYALDYMCDLLSAIWEKISIKAIIIVQNAKAEYENKREPEE